MRRDIILGQTSSSLVTKLFHGVSLAVMFMTGITVNILIFHVLHKRKVMRRNTTIILTHLLASNLIGCFVEIPAHISLYINPLEHIAEVTGTIYDSALYFTLFSSCGFFLLIFINRIDCITRPFEKKLKFKKIKAGLLCIWGAGALGTILLSVESTTNTLNESSAKRILSNACSIVHVILFSLIISAFLVGVVSHYRIYSYIRHHNRTAANSGIASKRRLRRRETRISKALFAHIGLFAFSYIPYVLIETTDTGSIIYRACRLSFSFRHTLNAIVNGGMMSEGVFKAVEEALHFKHSKFLTSPTYRSTFLVDKESKCATYGSIPHHDNKFAVGTESCVPKRNETASNEAIRNIQKLSRKNVDSNEKTDSVGFPSSYISVFSGNNFRSVPDFEEECSASAKHMCTKSILRVLVSAKGRGIITKEISKGMRWSLKQCVRASHATDNQNCNEESVPKRFHTKFYKETFV